MPIVVSSKESNFDCMEVSFPGIKSAISLLKKIGFIWEDLSKPFVLQEEGKTVAHVGMCEVRVIVDGKRKLFAAFHTLCTNPEYRKKGYGEKIVKEAVEYSKDRYENTLLFTDIPTYFVPFEFKMMEEHYFQFEPQLQKERKTHKLIPLRIDNPEHLALFREIVSKRVPLSNVFSMIECSDVIFAFNSLVAYPYFKDLYWSPDLNALIAYQKEGDSLKIFDVISTKKLDLDSLLSCFDFPFKKVFFFFSPDQFISSKDVTPIKYEDECLMVLNPHAMPQKPFMVPPFSRC